MASTKTQKVLKASTSITTSGGTVTGSVATCTTDYGGAVLVKLTNGASAPTVAPEADVLVSGDNSTFYIVAKLFGDTTASSVNNFVVDINPGIQYVNIQFLQATTNAYTAQAEFDELTTV